jgi:hypothetical protein
MIVLAVGYFLRSRSGKLFWKVSTEKVILEIQKATISVAGFFRFLGRRRLRIWAT